MTDCLTEEDHEETIYTMKHLNLLVDIFQYLPSQKKKGEFRIKTAFVKRNHKTSDQEEQSQKLNLSVSPTLLDKTMIDNLYKESQIDDRKTELKNLMVEVSAKMMERFGSIASVFRFFDVRQVGSVTFSDFCFGMDQLGMGMKKDVVM